MAIAFCLKEAGVSLEEVDHIAIGRDPKAKFLRKLFFFASRPFETAQHAFERFSNQQQVASLEQEFAKREKELQEASAKLRGMVEKLERDAPVMSEADRGKRQREISDTERDLQRRQREFREDLNQRRNEELAVVVERANKAIRQIAEAEKYDIIFQEAVYASPRIDITEKVVRVLNGQSK